MSKSINPKAHSYVLKHECEKSWKPFDKFIIPFGYISNGALLKAAQDSGFTLRQVSPRNPNACLNICNSNLKKVAKKK